MQQTLGSVEQNKSNTRSGMMLCFSRVIVACFYFGGNDPAEREGWMTEEKRQSREGYKQRNWSWTKACQVL